MPAGIAAFKICVLIPCFNNVAGLQKSLASITFKPDELLVLVVDDGSAEPVSETVLQGLTAHRVKVLTLPENQGITAALNAGLLYITTNLQVEFIARLDCGDTCHPERFYKQAAFLEKNETIGLLGTWCVFESADKQQRYLYHTPTRHPDLVREMYSRNAFIHPTVMFRTSLLRKSGFYPANYPHAEDYAFFMKLQNLTETAILPEYLVTCEINHTGISIRHRQKQLQSRFRVVKDFGKNFRLKLIGITKLKILTLLPYRLVLKLK